MKTMNKKENQKDRFKSSKAVPLDDTDVCESNN